MTSIIADSVKPAYCEDNPVMQLAFRDFVLFLWEDQDARLAFEKESGMPPLAKATSPFDKLIDQATGLESAYVEKFIEWAIKTQWGEA